MPRRDAYHQIVRNALEKTGWRITNDPLALNYKGLRVFVDLAAEKPPAKGWSAERIAIEIKVFGGRSKMDDFEKAIGQYTIYREWLERKGEPHELYLAVAQNVYDEFFQYEGVTEVIATQRVHLLIFEPTQEVITQWIKQPV